MLLALASCSKIKVRERERERKLFVRGKSPIENNNDGGIEQRKEEIICQSRLSVKEIRVLKTTTTTKTTTMATVNERPKPVENKR